MKIKKNILRALIVFCSIYFITVCFRAYSLRRPKQSLPLSNSQTNELNSILDKKYPQRLNIIDSLPYAVGPVQLDVWAKSCIAIDAKSGSILYQKNADEVIPPASLTKLVVLYVVFQEIATGRISLNDTVPLPPQTWASHMPPHSSLMFLGKNQIVTLEELMLGSAICSGNDAAYAIANYVCGGMEQFIERMNSEVLALGLQHTHFVEASGYSEENTTTAREIATFARAYLEKYPESIYKFHSKLSFTYPQEHNLPWEDRNLPRTQDFSNGLPDRITMPIQQNNTNPLLSKLEGCDGLKTGYIDESGYNLALTVKRENMRVISVTMGGPGANVKEGQEGRVHDGTEIMEWAFRTFKDYENPLILRSYSIPLVFAKSQRINLVPAFSPKALTVPAVAAKNPQNALEEININLVLPKSISGSVFKGEEYGSIEYYLGEHLLQRIPLVCERDVKSANLWFRFADLIAQLAILLF